MAAKPSIWDLGDDKEKDDEKNNKMDIDASIGFGTRHYEHRYRVWR